MTDIVLFHSALGLRPGVTHFAKLLRTRGHTVYTPDLYDGKILEDYNEGNEAFVAPGIQSRLQQAKAACQNLPENLVYAGFSNGAALAEFMAGTQPHARGAILMHGALPLAMLQLSGWPQDVPVQVHYNETDPFRNPDNDTQLQKDIEANSAQFEEFLYDGDTHLFADPDSPDYNETSATLMTKRVLAFLDHIDKA